MYSLSSFQRFGSSKDDHTCSQNLGLNHTLLAKTQLPDWFIENFSQSLPRITFKSPGGCFTIDAGPALCWTECVWLTDIIQTLGSVSSGSQPSAGADIHIMELRQARSPMQERVKTMENVFCIDGIWNTSFSCMSFDRAYPPPFLVWYFWWKVIALQMSATVLT